MKKIFLVLSVMLLSSLVFANGVSLNSPGTRAISMGGAYISIVDDYSAPYWNPAGLQNTMGLQGSLFITDLIPLATYEYSAADIDAKAKTNHYIAPNAAFLWTCRLYDRLRMGLSFIVPAGLGIEWEGEDLIPLAGGPTITTSDETYNNVFVGSVFDWESKIVAWNLSLSTAYTVGEKLNIGGAFHLNHGYIKLVRGIDKVKNDGMEQNPDGYLDTQYSEESDGWGYGLGLGIQYKLNDMITLGAAMRTKMKFSLSGDAEFDTIGVDYDRDITWPLWIGGGVAFRPIKKLLLSAEAQWTQWSEENYLIAEYDAMGKDSLTLLWDDAVQIRFGGEYLLQNNLALRAGFYFDPAPGPDKTQSILLPNTDFNVFTAGLGYSHNPWSLDIAFEYLIGKERDINEADIMPGVGMPGKHGMSILVPSIAITYKFGCDGKCEKCCGH